MKTLAKKNLEKILGALARRTLKKYKPSVIGVTGNVGKTSTKEALRIVLGGDRTVRAAAQNFNNELGLPLTVLGEWEVTGGALFWLKVIIRGIQNLVIKDGRYPELLILEYGVDAPGDMKKLIETVRPHIGVVTAVGDIPVHVEFFSGKEGVAREKARLVAALPATGFVVLNADDPAVLAMRGGTRARAITYGIAGGADVRVSNVEMRLEGGSAVTTYKITYGRNIIPVRLEGVVGKSQVYATAAAITAGVAFGLNLVKVTESLARYRPPKGRQNIIQGIRESVIIDDTYNAAPLAMKEALETLRAVKARRKVAVLGDMLELGVHAVEAHEEIGALVPKSAKVLLAVGAGGKLVADAAARAGMQHRNIFLFESVDEAGIFLERLIEEKDLVLVKASQGVRMERVVKEVMAHPETAEAVLVRQSPAWLAKPGLYDKK